MSGTTTPLMLVARCVRGLEWLVADEIETRIPQARALALAPREVTFRLTGPCTAPLLLRTVDDVFLHVGTVPGIDGSRPALARLAAAVRPWDWSAPLATLAQLRTVPDGPVFDVVASVEGRHAYNRYDVQDAVGAALAPVLGGRYLTRTPAGGPAGTPDVTVRVFVRPASTTVAVRLAGRPLHRRGYKQDTGPGTLHPPVAAALARLAGRLGSAQVLDPFCGDGTIAIETALCHPTARVRGGDIDPLRLANARDNAARAGISVRFSREDAGAPGPGTDIVITNPPWNLAVDARGSLRGSLDGFWRRLPSLLGEHGKLCLLADAGLGAPDKLPGLGFRLPIAGAVRLAGRVAHLVLATRPGEGPPRGVAAWRRRAIEAGVVTDTGF